MSNSEGPVMDEIRRVREQLGAAAEYDAHRLGEQLRELEKQYAERLVDQPTVVRSVVSASKEKKAG